MKKTLYLFFALLGSAQAQTVTVALDWTPNANHIGMYVASQLGWYQRAGLTVRLLPYASTSPETLVAAGRADIGVSGTEGVTAAVAGGQPLVSVAAIWATNTASLAVLEKSGIRRPRDLDGKVYAAFGAPYETAVIQRVIRADGGKGEYRSPVLNTFGLDALLSGRADFMWVFDGVEGVEAAHQGLKLRSFHLSNYGIPDYYTPVLVANSRALAQDKGKLRAFMSATARGYEYAKAHPKEAAALMLRAVPKSTFPDPAVLTDSLNYFVKRGAFAAPGRPWGEQTLKMWTDFPAFLLRSGAVKGPNGQPVSTLNYAALFSNALLPKR